MEIKYLGHSCFKLTEGKFSIIIDPYKAGSVPGLKPLKETANQTIPSHTHDDHSGLREVKLSSTRIDAPFVLNYFPTYHDDQLGTLRGPNNVILLEANGLSVVHMGDIGCDLEWEQIERIRECDVLMIPVGGFYTISPEKAADLIREVNPKIAIPMHYRGDTFGYDVLGTLDNFLKNFKEGERIIEEADSVIEITSKPVNHRILCMKPEKAE